MSAGYALPGHLVVAAKSGWSPGIRREHALAQEALRSGCAVDFVEQPSDVRHALPLASSRRFLDGFAGAATVEETVDGPVRVWRRSTVLPGHRGAVAWRSNTRLLRRVLAKAATPESTVMCQAPWDWAAVRATPARVRVFDCTDSWVALMPHRAGLLKGMYARIAREADHIVVVNPSLAAEFPGADVTVVRNGVASTLLEASLTPRPGARRMVSVGTLSERFDVQLVAQVLHQLPDWRLDLYGQCRYAGMGDQPSPELRKLLDAPGSRLRWHGVAPRSSLRALLDGADVLVVANRPELSQGQSSMKVFDYAARGRPIVTSVPDMTGADSSPPGTRLATTAEDFAAAVVAASHEPGNLAAERRAWAAAATWASRWQEWQSAVLGAPMQVAAAGDQR